MASFLDLVNIASVGFFTMAAATYGAAYLAPFLLVRMIQFDNQFIWPIDHKMILLWPGKRPGTGEALAHVAILLARCDDDNGGSPLLLH